MTTTMSPLPPTDVPPDQDSVRSERPPKAARSASRGRVAVLLLVAFLAASTTACKPFDTLDQFASLKYESPARLAVIAHNNTTEILYSNAVKNGVQSSRNLILQFAPKWNWNTPLCYSGVGTLMFCSYVAYIESRFSSDVRTRSDFWESLKQAHNEKGCWTWSFTVPNTTNFTTRSASNDHCT